MHVLLSGALDRNPGRLSLAGVGPCRARTFVNRLTASILILVLIGSSGFPEAAAQQKHTQAKQSKAKHSKSALMGVWWSPEMPEAAAFDIKDSTIYYPDQFIERRYRLKGDTLFVEFDDGFVAPSIILRITADTLILFSWDHEQVYTRKETGEGSKRE